MKGSHLYYIFIIMVADDLAMQGAMASAAMVLTRVSPNIPVSAPEGHYKMATSLQRTFKTISSNEFI